VNPRDFALIVLDRKRLPGWKGNLLGGGKVREPNDARDRALAERIVNGVVKNLLRLQDEVEHYSRKSAVSIEPLVQKILVIGLYQLKFMDRVPASAAVDQAVEQTKRFGRRRAAGFVNAVLRNVGRRAGPAEPDVNTDPEGYARRMLSHPPKIFRRLAGLLGNERAIAFCRHDNEEPAVILRLFKGVEIAALVAGWAELANLWKEQGREELPAVELMPHEMPGLVVARGAREAMLAHWARQGLAQVQDATAADVVERMQILPAQRVLDRCAGMGTKTMQILDRVGETGEVVAVDASEARCEELRRLALERGLKNLKVMCAAKMCAAGEISGSFDRILIDVPCSNSGVLARRPEARYRSGMDCLVKIQREILEDTKAWLGNGGILIYSTCSVWPEENELQVREFLVTNPELELIEERLVLPSFGETLAEKYHDGGYWAALRKR